MIEDKYLNKNANIGLASILGILGHGLSSGLINETGDAVDDVTMGKNDFPAAGVLARLSGLPLSLLIGGKIGKSVAKYQGKGLDAQQRAWNYGAFGPAAALYHGLIRKPTSKLEELKAKLQGKA